MKTNNPAWWSTEHESRWDKVKAAFRRDWEQTKHDMGSDTARDLQQSASDTVKQAAGSQQQAGTQPVRGFEDVEPAYRYGHGAQTQYKGAAWNDELEMRLKTDYPGDYRKDRDYIRRAYDYR
jgi:hypothetical protein